MNIKYILDVLGSKFDDELLRETLLSQEIVLPQTLELKKSHYDIHIEFLELGLSLLFTDEARFLGINNQPIGIGRLYFSGIFFYSDGEGNSEFDSSLPFNLSFTDKVMDVENKLGKASSCRDRKGRIISQRWDNAKQQKFTMHITYDSDTNNIFEMITFIPNK